MKILPTVLFFLLVWLIVCTPPADEISATETGLLIPDYLIGEVELRLHNQTGSDLDAVAVTYGENRFDFGRIETNAMTEYATLPFIYQSFSGTLTIDDKTITVTPLDSPEQSGEEPIVGGAHTLILQATDSTFFGNVQPDETIVRDRLMPLIDLLDADGATVTYTPSLQRPDMFTKSADAPTAARELLDVNGQRVLVYIFPNEVAALQASALIQPGSAELIKTGADGVTHSLSPTLWSGGQPVWWQHSNIILLTDGREARIHEHITQALGTLPLGGQVAEFVPTATPVTPPLAGDVYMARRNFDPEGFPDALLTGELRVENGCLVVRGDNSAETYLPIWPRRYTLDERDAQPSVLDENGAVVFSVGERAYLGGSGDAIGNRTGSLATLVDPLPERCAVTHVWDVGSILPAEYRDDVDP